MIREFVMIISRKGGEVGWEEWREEKGGGGEGKGGTEANLRAISHTVAVYHILRGSK